MNQPQRQPKPKDLRRWDLEDPYIVGALRTRGPKQECALCGRMVLGIQTVKITLPPTIDREHTLLKGAFQRKFLGINCGCYAKVHRQIAHIITKQAQAANA